MIIGKDTLNAFMNAAVDKHSTMRLKNTIASCVGEPNDLLLISSKDDNPLLISRKEKLSCQRQNVAAKIST